MFLVPMFHHIASRKEYAIFKVLSYLFWEFYLRLDDFDVELRFWEFYLRLDDFDVGLRCWARLVTLRLDNL